MNAGIALAAMGNIGLLACAAIDTAAVIAYWAKAHSDRHGRWWRTPFGVHLMCFMAAFAIVLDQSAVYLITTGQVIPHVALPGRPDWFAWVRVTSFCTLIPAVLAWRLLIILRPPSRRLGGSSRPLARHCDAASRCGIPPSSFIVTGRPSSVAGMLLPRGNGCMASFSHSRSHSAFITQCINCRFPGGSEYK